MAQVLMKKIIFEYFHSQSIKTPTLFIEEIEIVYSGNTVLSVRKCELKPNLTKEFFNFNDFPIINGTAHMIMLSKLSKYLSIDQIPRKLL